MVLLVLVGGVVFLSEEMRAEVVVVWVGLTLCCALVCAQEDVEEKKLSGGQIQVRGAGEPVEPRSRREEGGVEMSDEPTDVVEEERTKPKKKKTPEEIEAGKLDSNMQTCFFMNEHLRHDVCCCC